MKLSELYALLDNLNSQNVDISELKTLIYQKEREILLSTIAPELKEICDILLQEIRQNISISVEYSVENKTRINVSVDGKWYDFKDNYCENKVCIPSWKEAISNIININKQYILDTSEIDYNFDKSSDTCYATDDVICTHLLDWCSFRNGFAIDRKYHKALFSAVGQYIQRGTSLNVVIKFHERFYDVRIGNADVNGRAIDTIQLLYRGSKNNIGGHLKELYPALYNYIYSFKEQHAGKSRCSIPYSMQKMLVLKKTSDRLVFEMEVVESP